VRGIVGRPELERQHRQDRQPARIGRARRGRRLGRDLAPERLGLRRRLDPEGAGERLGAAGVLAERAGPVPARREEPHPGPVGGLERGIDREGPLGEAEAALGARRDGGVERGAEGLERARDEPGALGVDPVVEGLLHRREALQERAGEALRIRRRRLERGHVGRDHLRVEREHVRAGGERVVSERAAERGDRLAEAPARLLVAPIRPEERR
jgi:hypothetical protein